MSRTAPKSPTADSPSFGKPLRVLLVEDSRSDADLYLRELKRAGFEVRADLVQTPEEYDQRLRSTSYDIVLADYRLPDWTGLDALSQLQQMEKDIPFVLVTGTLGEEAAVECVKQGVTEYVLKQHLARLPVAVHRALQEKALRKARALAEQSLRESEASFRLLFANIPVPMWVFDLETLQFVQVNDAAMAHYGYSREEFLQLRIIDIHPAEEIPRLLQSLSGAEPSLPASGQWRHRLKDGRIIDVEMIQHPLEFTGRKAVLAVGQDITERRQAEEALRMSEARYRELVKNATYGIFRASREDRFLDVNPALVAMLGYGSEGEVLSLNLATDVFLDPEARTRLFGPAAGRDRVEGLEMEWRRKDGSPVLVRLSGRAARVPSGDFAHFEGIAEDVTERRALEKQLRRVHKFEAIGQLAGGIAHDFNNVIGAILGWAELGQDQTAPDTRVHSHFKKIQEQAARAAGLTRQLLAFARRQILEPQNIHMNQTIAELLSLLEKVIGKDVELKTVLAPNLGMVRADPSQVEQVLMNLCLNARDAMPRGGRLLIETQDVELDEEFCRNYADVRPGRYVRLSVTDNGEGMDAATLEHIFEPFFTTKELGKGTGLGLATVYGVVKQHAGLVQVYSEPGRGTTFHVYLPLSATTPQKVDKRERTRSGPVRGGAETILVAEDHDGVREMARATLDGLGYQVILANDGEEAVRVFQEHREAIALVLLDVVMPKLGGPEAYARMAAEKAGLPVLFVTGYSAEAASLSAMLEKGAAVLQKPYRPAHLGRKVREILDCASHAAAGCAQNAADQS